MKSTVYLAIATFLLGAVSSWYLSKWYYEPSNVINLSEFPNNSDIILHKITDTSGIHARNVNAQKSEDTIKSNNFETKTQLHEIKNNLRYDWNIALNDSLLNAWGQFEAKHGKLLLEDGPGDR
jgi:hypothetical protein